MRSNELQLQLRWSSAGFRAPIVKKEQGEKILFCILFAKARASVLHLIVISFHYKRLKSKLPFVREWKGHNGFWHGSGREGLARSEAAILEFLMRSGCLFSQEIPVPVQRGRTEAAPRGWTRLLRTMTKIKVCFRCLHCYQWIKGIKCR